MPYIKGKVRIGDVHVDFRKEGFYSYFTLTLTHLNLCADLCGVCVCDIVMCRDNSKIEGLALHEKLL